MKLYKRLKAMLFNIPKALQDTDSLPMQTAQTQHTPEHSSPTMTRSTAPKLQLHCCVLRSWVQVDTSFLTTTTVTTTRPTCQWQFRLTSWPYFVVTVCYYSSFKASHHHNFPSHDQSESEPCSCGYAVAARAPAVSHIQLTACMKN